MKRKTLAVERSGRHSVTLRESPGRRLPPAGQRSSARCSWLRCFLLSLESGPQNCATDLAALALLAASDVPCGNGAIGATGGGWWIWMSRGGASRSRAGEPVPQAFHFLECAQRHTPPARRFGRRKVAGTKAKITARPACVMRPRWIAPYRPPTGRSGWAHYPKKGGRISTGKFL